MAVVLVIVAVPIGALLGLPHSADRRAAHRAGHAPARRAQSLRADLQHPGSVRRQPVRTGLLYGLLLGPLALPCAGAFALALIASSVGLADALAKIVVFLVYGLGFGLPLVVLSVLAGARQRQSPASPVTTARSTSSPGPLLIAVGIGDLFLNLESLRLRFGF